MAFTLANTGCHRPLPRTENVPVRLQSRTFNLRGPGQRDSLHAVVSRQRELWRAGDPRDYDFLLRVSCFCPGQKGWVLIEVRDGKAVRNNYSIDGLFDLLKQDADRDDVVAVSFDDRWHYPAYISTDMRVGLPDDWGIVEVRGFRPR